MIFVYRDRTDELFSNISRREKQSFRDPRSKKRREKDQREKCKTAVGRSIGPKAGVGSDRMSKCPALRSNLFLGMRGSRSVPTFLRSMLPTRISHFVRRITFRWFCAILKITIVDNNTITKMSTF